ncbi:MAG: CDP-alcohol phosphatidyltransferase family protein [Rhodospirillaceae bacterium]
MNNPPHSASAELTRRAGLYVACGGAVLGAGTFALAAHAGFSAGFSVAALATYLMVGVFAVSRIARHHPFARFGTANILTLVRLLIASSMAGLAFEMAFHERVIDNGLAWGFFSLAVTTLVLDGLDGYAARRENLASDFGARFDMEIDALQILLLCLIALALEKAGLWVLIGGALRYAYEVAGVFWPPLQRPLPPSFRRKLTAAVQGGTLAALLAPIIVPPLSTRAAAIALLLLIYSFAVDVIWLAIEDARAKRAS